MQDVGIGVDLGSTEFRIGIFDYYTDSLVKETKEKVPYFRHGNGIITQCTSDILTAVEKAFNTLYIQEYNICSLGVGATCSMVVGKQKDENLIPFNLIHDKNGRYHDIIFWMHSAAIEETEYLNNITDESILCHFGGKFFPEMAIPKLLHLNKLYKDDGLTVLDLHIWLLWKISLKLGHKELMPVQEPNSNGIGHDGELFGWSKEFYEHLQLNKIFIGNNAVIKKNEQFGDSCIDCYASWFQCWSTAMLNRTLFVVAGTSTCFLYASDCFESFIPGIWGPFKDILVNRKHISKHDNYSVYEAGISRTGVLLEKLLSTHPAVKDSDVNFLETVEHKIDLIEQSDTQSIHLMIKNTFFHEDYEEFESSFVQKDTSGSILKEGYNPTLKDLELKYVVIIETLAFQIVDVINAFEEGHITISKLLITGSQAKNSRLLQILQVLLEEISIDTPCSESSTAGVKGAYQLGKAHRNNTALLGYPQEATPRPCLLRTDDICLTDVQEHLREKYISYGNITGTKIR